MLKNNLLTQNIRRGTYVLNSNENLVIDSNITISAIKSNKDYFTDDSIFYDTCGNEMGRALFFARGAENIVLSGKENSLIDGFGYEWKRGESKRPSLIRFVECKNVTIKNLKLINSPSWCIHLQNCKDVHIENLTIISDCNANNDGIDLDGCTNVHVTNCYIDNGDDAIVLKSTKNVLSNNILIENCTINTLGSAFKIGTESVGDFSDIKYVNNVIKHSRGCAVKIVPVDGAKVYNVEIKNIVAEKTTGPIFIANGYRQRTYFEGHKKETKSTIDNVKIENFNANVYINEENEFTALCKGVVFVSGTDANRIKNVSIIGCVFNMPGGQEQKDYIVKDLTNEYPEYYILGTAPASGAYFRRVDGVELKNISFNFSKDDQREKIIFVDTTNVVYND